MKKDRVLEYIALGLFICLCISLFINYKQYRDAREKPDTVEVVTTVATHEKTDTAPKPKSETQVGVVSVPVKNVSSSGGKISKDSTEISDGTLTMVGDSVEIPISQKVYEDSLYTAYVSGYRQSLDSIKVRERIVTTRITETRTETEFRRWNIGLTAGYGYAVRNKNLDFFVGIGLTYNLFPEKKRKRATAVVSGF